MRFEFASVNRIVFGPGTLKEVGGIASTFGKHALVVVGYGAADPAQLLSYLHEKGVATMVYTVQGEPTLALV